jgi:hypothetical protein
MNNPNEKPRSRVTTEVRDMYQQLLLGTLLGTILRVLLDILGILLLLAFTYSSLIQLYPTEPCVHACFEGKPQSACWMNIHTIIRALILLLSLAIGSFLSTHYKSRQKFQHSSSVTGGILTLIIVSQIWNSYPLGIIFLTLVSVFISTYIGYRFWFIKRDRKKIS